ncbi:hypothetical protein Tco_0550346 [Tanacetum coccineum]
MLVELPKFEADKVEKNKIYKSSRKYSSFNTKSEHGSLKLNSEARDQKEGGGTKGTRDQNARVEQHRQDLQPTDELSVPVLKTTLDLKRAIKER